MRHTVAIAGVLLMSDGPPRAVLVTDVSECGCRIGRPAGLEGHDAVTLSFGGFAPFDAQVIWTSSQSAGLRFDYPAHPALIQGLIATASKRGQAEMALVPDLVRRENRERLWHLRLPVTITAAGVDVGGTLFDVSIDGCRIATTAEALPGTTVQLAIARRPSVTGVVRWSARDAIGVQFASILTPEMLESICVDKRLAD